MNRKRTLARVAVAIAALLIAGDFLAHFLQVERHRALIERKLSEAAGLDVAIGGGLRLHLFPTPRFEAKDVTVANLPGRPSPHLLAADSITLAFVWRRLLVGAIEIDDLTLSGVELHVESDDRGGFFVAQDVDTLVDDEVAGSFDLRIRRFEVDDARVSVFDGASGKLTTLHVSELVLAAEAFDEPISFEARGEFDGAGFALTGSGGAPQELLAATAPYPVAFGGRLFEASIEVDGTIAAPLELGGLDVGFSAEIASLAGLAYEATAAAPRIGPIAASGRLTNPGGVLGAHEIAITATGESGVRGELSGSIADLAAMQGVALTARLDADDLAFLEPFVELPEDASLQANLNLSDRDGSLGAEGTARAATPDGRLEIEATGAHDDISRLDGIDVQLRAHARDLAAIGSALGLPTELPPIGAVDGTAHLRDRDGVLALEDIAITLGGRDKTWAELNGAVGELARFRGVELTASLRVADPDALAARLGFEIPDTGPISGSARLADADGTLGIEKLELHGGREGALAIDLSGSFDDVREIDEVELQIALSARHLGVIGSLFEADLPAIGPVEFTGRAKGSDEKIVSSGTLRLGDTHFSGDWSGAFVPGTRPSVKARIESPHVHLDDIGIEPRPAGSPGPSRDAAAAAKRLWSEGPLPFDQIHAVDADLEIRADRVTGRSDFEISDTQITFRIDDGELTIREIGGDYETGSLELSLRVDARTPVPSIAFLANARGIDLTHSMSQFQRETEHGGLLDLAVDVESRGRTVDEIRSQLAGRVEGRLRDGSLASVYARKLLLEVALVSIPDFRPNPQARIGCFAVALDIDQGVVGVETLRIEAPRLVVTGTGEVDLAANRFRMQLTPEPRDPSLLSVAATVRVRGPLTDPSFKPVRRSLATSAARAVVKNVWKPAGMLTRPLRRSKADNEADDCPLDPFVPNFDPAPDANSKRNSKRGRS